MALLKVDDIHVYYGSIHAVKGISFTVEEGEIVTLIGANGAGKSTVLNTVSGLLHPKTGSVIFEDKDLKGVAPHKVVERGLAQVPEGRRIFLQMTVQELRLDLQPVERVEKGAVFSMAVGEKVRRGDKLYKWVDTTEELMQ